MKRTYAVLIVLMGLLTTIFPIASYAANDQILTLDQAVKLALDYDAQVATARNNVAKAKLVVEQTVLKSYPQATVEDSQTHDFIKNANPNILTLTIQETYPTNFNLYGNKVISDIEAAFWDQVTNEAALRIAEANVRYNTISLYIAALEAKKNVEYQEKATQNAQAALELAQIQMKQAKITRPDELQAENNLTNAQFNLAKNKSDFQLALLQLGNQIGVQDPVSLQLADLNAAMENVDLTRLKDESLPKRMELQQAEITIRKAERTVAQSKNQNLPQLDLTYNSSNRSTGYSIGYDFLNGNVSGSWEGRTNSDPSYSKNSSNSLLDYNRSNIQLTLTWSLDFGTVKNQIKQDEITLANAKKSLESTKQSAGWEIDQAIANYRLAAQKVNTNQQLLPFYQKQLDLKKLTLQLGSAVQQDVATAEQNLLQAKLQVELAQYDYFLAYQKLKQVTGGLYQ